MDKRFRSYIVVFKNGEGKREEFKTQARSAEQAISEAKAWDPQGSGFKIALYSR